MAYLASSFALSSLGASRISRHSSTLNN
jgi:hypothetical protein